MKAGLCERRPRGRRKGEPSRYAMRQAITAGPATQVRGSSRRIHDHVGNPFGLIHEYQSDQPSATASSAFARTALLRKRKKRKTAIDEVTSYQRSVRTGRLPISRRRAPCAEDGGDSHY